MSAATLAILVGSLALHAVVVATLVTTGRPAAPPPTQEIAVDIVRDIPKPMPIPAKREAAKSSEQAKFEPAKSEPAKSEPVKAQASKLDPPKSAEPPKLAARPEPSKPVAKAASPAPKPAAEASELESLQKELAALKAEHAALASHAEGQAPVGTGPLADGFQAVALPGAVDGGGEAASYQEIVFSQLAKAKDIGQRKGVAGTSGVRFEINAAGELVSADVVSPSGVAALDAEALAIVHKAAPFPPPPKDAQREFFANVNFVPQGGP